MNNEARQAILDSISANLAASAPYDAREKPIKPEILANQGGPEPLSAANVCALFKQNLESVSGHCYLAQGETKIAQVLEEIISGLRAQRIAISDAPQVERTLHLTDLEIEELGIAPGAGEIFRFDAGVTTAQAAIAETGTLVLDSSSERHRLVSLVPPVHIAIVAASKIRATLGETLAMLQSSGELSPAITFVTGPSRTADIELTLTIGVHGPQELYVIIDESA